MCKFLSILLLFFSINALATDTYNSTTNILNIDSVILNGIQYNNVVIQLTGYNVISVGSYAPVNVTAKCSSNNFSPAIYNAISIGMTISQVEQTIGCNFDPTKTVRGGSFVLKWWSYLNPTTYATEMIGVYFDGTDSVVTAIGGTLFKQSQGF